MYVFNIAQFFRSRNAIRGFLILDLPILGITKRHILPIGDKSVDFVYIADLEGEAFSVLASVKEKILLPRILHHHPPQIAFPFRLVGNDSRFIDPLRRKKENIGIEGFHGFFRDAAHQRIGGFHRSAAGQIAGNMPAVSAPPACCW